MSRCPGTGSLIAVGAIATGTWLGLSSERQPAPGQSARLLVDVKRGDVGLRDSRRGRPIVTASGLAPGSTVRGRITLRNVGETRLSLKLARRNLADRPGPNGGTLSEVLKIQIRERSRKRPRKSGPRRPSIVYEGSLSKLRRVRLRALDAHAKRTYAFAVKMPDGGSAPTSSGGDNAYQGSRTSVDFVWRGRPRS